MPAPRNRYGHQHNQRRKQWAPRVKRGEVTCWRCGERILPTDAWDLGHADGSATVYAGPEHRKCNRGAAGKLSQQRQRGKALITSENW